MAAAAQQHQLHPQRQPQPELLYDATEAAAWATVRKC